MWVGIDDDMKRNTDLAKSAAADDGDDIKVIDRHLLALRAQVGRLLVVDLLLQHLLLLRVQLHIRQQLAQLLATEQTRFQHNMTGRDSNQTRNVE